MAVSDHRDGTGDQCVATGKDPKVGRAGASKGSNRNGRLCVGRNGGEGGGGDVAVGRDAAARGQSLASGVACFQLLGMVSSASASLQDRTKTAMPNSQIGTPQHNVSPAETDISAGQNTDSSVQQRARWAAA